MEERYQTSGQISFSTNIIINCDIYFIFKADETVNIVVYNRDSDMMHDNSKIIFIQEDIDIFWTFVLDYIKLIGIHITKISSKCFEDQS